jgi:dihydrofolate synthase/folylpolyglutamate synthase
VDPLGYLFSLEHFGIKFGLANIRTLCGALGNPQTAFPSVLIAGTNGKGSVSAMVGQGLRSAGLDVGRYTSPHLVRLEERFAINGAPVETASLVELADEMRQLVDDLISTRVLEAPPTFFEVTTAIAFELFRRRKVDFAVLEVGLGGKFDSTNLVEPTAAAITSIAFDHEQYLGHTLGAIAAEKAGVVRRGIPVVVGPLGEEPHQVITSACAAAGAHLVDACAGVELESDTHEGRATVRLKTPACSYGQIHLALRGAHQISNAIVAVRLLEELGPQTGVRHADIVSALQDVQWPGRLQLLEGPDGRRVLLDAAHNPAGAATLADYLAREFPAPMPLVFASMRDKDAAAMLGPLLPLASALVLTEPSISRARPAEELASIARAVSPACPVEIVSKPIDALKRAWTHAPLVTAAGSIFLIGELLEGLGPGVRTL